IRFSVWLSENKREQLIAYPFEFTSKPDNRSHAARTPNSNHKTGCIGWRVIEPRIRRENSGAVNRTAIDVGRPKARTRYTPARIFSAKLLGSNGAIRTTLPNDTALALWAAGIGMEAGRKPESPAARGWADY